MIASDEVGRRWIPVGGRLLHHLDFGGRGRLVVCLHGVTSCAWVWHHVARSLTWGEDRPAGPSAAMHVVACDLRGHGDSGWAGPDQYHTRQHAADLASVVTQLADQPVDVVGNSWGALVGLALAAERPGLVRRLVMVDIEPSFDQPETLDPPRVGRFDNLTAAAASWRSSNPSGPEDLIQLVAAASTRPHGDGGLMARHDPLFLRRFPFRSEDWWPSLDAVTAPTLVIKAENSWVRSEVCDEMADRLRQGERLNLPATAHTVPVDAPDLLAAVVSRFLEA